MDLDRRQFLTAVTGAAVVSATAQPASSGKKYRACVIGDEQHGGYGHDLHRVWGCREDVEVVGLADPDEAARNRRARECGARNLYADYREMLEKEAPDLVAVGPRWTTRHKEYVLACAAKGAHGILEKPLSVDLAEADEMIAALDAKNLKWAIAFNFRATPTIAHVKKLVTEDRIIGSVLELRGRGKEDDARAGGEDLIVLGVHIFDLMTYLMGMPVWCAADITHNGKPAAKTDVREATEPLGPVVGNRIAAMFGFAQGVPGYFGTMKSRDGNGGRWGLDIYGSQGAISIRQDPGPVVHLLRDASWAPGHTGAKWEPLPDAPAEVPQDDPLQRYAAIIHDLIAAIEEDRRPAVSIHDGRNAHEMIQAVFESYVHGARVDIPLQERVHPLSRWA
jgi:predicted dehydrogenase